MTEAGEGTTLVLLNSKRPQNVRHIPLNIEEYECITEVMVVHQLSKTQVEHSRSRITIRRLQGFSREAYGCAQRYFYAPFAQNRFVLFSHILFSIHNRRVTHTLPKQNKGRIKALPKGEVGMEKSVRHTKQRSAICKIHSPGFSFIDKCFNQLSSLCLAQRQLNCSEKESHGSSICGF